VSNVPSQAQTSEVVTNDIRVHVTARYSSEHSRPNEGKWFFLYTIVIANEGADTVQLISRHWIITDAASRVEEVRGLGVIGQQPVLQPGESFEYTSGCPLTTPFGSMTGSYQIERDDGSKFDAQVAPFALTEPYTIVH
jgi:ApaG protein